MPRIILLLYALLMTTGCSIAMALSGTPDPEFDKFGPGSSRSEVEAQLGKPLLSETLADGNKKDTYEVEIGNNPNSARAVFNFYMDLATLLIWELPGTIIEANIGNDERIYVTYGPDERVVRLEGYQPPAPTAVEKEAIEAQKEHERPRGYQRPPSQPASP